MLLMFPTFEGVPVKDDSVIYVRSLSRDKFNRTVAQKVSAGWTVHEMTSSFRKTAFGGSTAYYAELRRGSGTGKKEE